MSLCVVLGEQVQAAIAFFTIKNYRNYGMKKKKKLCLIIHSTHGIKRELPNAAVNDETL